MISLDQFTENDFDRLMVWVMNEDDLIQFAGPIFDYPLTKSQLLKYITNEQRKVFKVVFDKTKEAIGHCELNMEKRMPRLSRILIGEPAFRNMGIGFRILDLMLFKLFVEGKADQADLNVFEWNKSAIRSYEKIGFLHAPGRIDNDCKNMNGWTAVNMIINKATWLSHSKLTR